MEINEADVIFEIETEDTDYDEYPFNPNDISIDKRTVLVETCIKRLTQNTIILNPDFQRNEVWDEVRKSRLIESLMLKIPIPMFYVSADERNVFTVVDGLQRLSSLRDFVLGNEQSKSKKKELRLQGLEFWTQYNGKSFKELPTYLQNRITETELTFTVINPGTPEEVKRNIFKRINTGGLFLTSQEIRNALYTGKATILLHRMAQSEDFLKATSYSVSPKRMDDLELVLRCVSFLLRDRSYYPKNSSMDTFLSDTMQIINSYPDYNSHDMIKLFKQGGVTENSINKVSLDDLMELFTLGMRRSCQLFGKHCFRKSHGEQRRSPLNKALFEMWGSILATLSEVEFIQLKTNSKQFYKEYYTLLDNVDFQNLTSRDSWKFTSLQKRFAIIDSLVQKYIF